MNLLQFESDLHTKGFSLIAGVDEVGRGCLAGPVFAATVVFPPHLRLPGINDSKELRPATRDFFFEKILEVAVDWAVFSVDHTRIDEINIHHASLEAMRGAVQRLKVSPDFLLVDGRFPLNLKVPERPIIRGDALSQSIAAASIVAKVLRDQWMCQMAKQFPDFGFEAHKGYGTLRHREAIREFGPSPIHRKSFSFS
ncbi:MAG: ribonuclease HII [Deltaproteobacteria bacterium]|nr:ribonuclease HII [Deltaproteobacteria bacterium]MBI4374612.1 ribonuclease HII [Deltaproteobacteria bacterium]